MCDLLILTCKSPITNDLYHDEKSCTEMIYYISTVVHKKNLDRIRDSNFFGLMIDESTDINSISYVVVFGTFVEEGLLMSFFGGLFKVPNGKKDAGLIFEGLQKRIKEWGVDEVKWEFWFRWVQHYGGSFNTSFY